MEENYLRKITHNEYRNPDKLKKYYHRVEKQIYVQPANSIDPTPHKNLNYYMDHNFIYYPSKGNFMPLYCGGVSLAFFLVFIWPSDEPLNGADKFFMVLSMLLTIFFAIYFFTKPKKEQILNRRDGLITMTGVFWQKNITMSFEKSEFAYSTGGEDMIGAFLLEVIRPNKWPTFDYFGYGGNECYESMSFITWYMDKNRPLPPGAVFDPYRQSDFERRKSEGFPRPLYPSKIKTPEATKEQQAVRDRLGGW